MGNLKHLDNTNCLGNCFTAIRFVFIGRPVLFLQIGPSRPTWPNRIIHHFTVAYKHFFQSLP